MIAQLRRPAASIALVFLALVVLITGATALAPDPDKYDVIVVGAGPGGIGAAMQAASMGSKVALVEETSWVGGQITASGVSTMDEGSVAPRSYGVYGEFVSRASSYYKARDKSMHTCYASERAICVEPSVAQRILQQMIGRYASIEVLVNTKVIAVTKRRNTTVSGIRTSSQRMLKGDVVIDASEYGDVMPLAGASYRVGTGTSTQPAPDSCIADFTYVAVLRRYPEGTPAPLLLKTPPPGYSPGRVASFVRAVRNGGLDLQPGYPAPWNFTAFIRYRGIPDSSNPGGYDPKVDGGKGITRTSVNIQANDARTSTRFIEDPAFRAETICDAKLKTLQFLYYIQHDLGHPEWSIANDEGYDEAGNVADRHCPLLDGYEEVEKYFPLQPYVREGRRLVGVETLTGADILRNGATGQKARQFGNSVAVGYFPVDLHRCDAPGDFEAGLDTPEDQTGSAGPFEVPLGALVPTNVDGFIVAEKNVSASRVAMSAMRLQPISFAVGQAAGALASLSAKQNLPPRAVDPTDVRAALTKSNSQIDVPK